MFYRIGICLALMCLTASANAQQATVDLQFDWTASICASPCINGVDGYRISAVGGGIIADTANVGATVADYALTVGVEQCFTIHAYNVDGQSDESSPECVTIPPGVPSIPTNLIVTFPVN